MLETELYQPVAAYFGALGYKVRGEVKNCDIAGIKNEELIVVELKTSANMTLLIQATERQAFADKVYVAIPKPKNSGKPWRGIQRVVKRAGLGLLIVQESPLGMSVLKLFDPEPLKVRRNKRKRLAVIEELESRNSNDNVGGSVGIQLMTAYKENAILIACYINRFGESKPVEMRSFGTGKKTLAILSSNHYGWFERIRRGVYGLSKKGFKEAMGYAEVCEASEKYFDKKLPKSSNS
ncbi:MAG: hypothetical protein JKY88_02740 [Pseudomonadales bacterium]|nr:hypothetical protein [Pseudomonadales bacterium]